VAVGIDDRRDGDFIAYDAANGMETGVDLGSDLFDDDALETVNRFHDRHPSTAYLVPRT
jgi:hypothetical protein